MSVDWKNWAGNITFEAARVHRPESVEQVQEIVSAAEQVRVLGSGHSFNRIADTTADLVSVAGLPAEVRVDAERGTVSVAGGVRYGELAAQLDAAGYALHNLGSLPHISIAGAVATGTHGSGAGLGNLATAIAGLQLVTADGELVELRRDDPDFAGAVVALGALGVVVRVELDISPTYQVRQTVYEDLPRARVDAHWAELATSAYSVSLFTDWSGDTVNQVWLKRLDDGEAAPAELFGARPADGPRHPISGVSPVNCTEQGDVPGPWHTRLPHFRLEFTPSSGEELQSEFFVARQDAVAAFAAVERVRHLVTPVLQISEVRVVAADDLWLSPHYRRDSVALHFTWVPDTEAVLPAVAALEAELAPFGARPHWGKVFHTAPDYERMGDFRALAARLDPQGKFRNAFVRRHLFGE
ncbi:FAD-binding protein [Dactylosporangium sp. AC04546]|uniref:FAD-binding protein n=1 Tax=Dactylosporangium sp. AC04546 TaxID=2862460 RepID=UPI001EE0C819|nr:FAD-binding protein [Dactylosporangium sp. AC04546]WVK85196.1 FAD-binding protein [Dactylosporangium sp. AC04546]